MAQRPPIRVLVTGFGPFPGVRSNPSGDMLAWLKERRARISPGAELVTIRIPTGWAAVEEFVAGALFEFDPDIALHFGVHQQATGFRVETRARNCASTQADADGQRFTRGSPEAGRSPALCTTIEAGKIVHKLRVIGLPADPSADAGRYICNMLFYLSLKQSVDQRRARQTGFIHIPPLAAASHRARRSTRPNFDRNTLLKGAETIIDHCIAAHGRVGAMATLPR